MYAPGIVFTSVSPAWVTEVDLYTKGLRNEKETVVDFSSLIMKRGKGSRGCCLGAYLCLILLSKEVKRSS